MNEEYGMPKEKVFNNFGLVYVGKTSVSKTEEFESHLQHHIKCITIKKPLMLNI